MNTRRLCRTASVPLVLAAALALAACTGDAPAPAGTASAPAASTPAATPTPTAPTAPPVAGGGADCLVGTWTMDEAALTAFYEQIGAMAGGVMAFSPVGSATLTMDAAGSYTWAPDATITASASGIDVEVVLGGSIRGSYAVDGDRITTGTDSVDELSITASAGGVEIDPGAVAEGIRSAPLNDSTYACSDHELTLTTVVTEQTLTSTFAR